MEKFQFLADPWWVNLLILVPLILFFLFRGKLKISPKILLASAVFGVVFGFVEAAVVVYLRSNLSLIADFTDQSINFIHPLGSFQQFEISSRLPKYLLRVEFFREIATMIMLLSAAYIAANRWLERLAVFFWVFAFWDIFYYVFLRLTIGWPQSLTTSDVLFLIPTPWISQVWYPLLISALFILAVIFRLKNN